MARFPGHDEALSEVLVTQEDLDYATQQVRVIAIVGCVEVFRVMRFECILNLGLITD
jgi:hypothetical protein